MSQLWTFDTVILGAGGGGYPAAFRLAKNGHRVLLVDDKGNLGGHCMFEGCIPSKTVREASQLVRMSQRDAVAGVSLSLRNVAIPSVWQSVRAFKDGVQTRRYAQHAEEIEETANLTMVKGRGKLLNPNEVEVTDTIRGKVFKAEFHFLIIATGSSARMLPIPGGESTWTSHQFFAWLESVPELPKSLILIGGGYIGVEMAMMLDAFGVKTTILEAMPTILPQMDSEIQKELALALQNVATVVTHAKVTQIDSRDGEKWVQVESNQGPRLYRAQQVVTAVGRIPNVSKELGLDNAGIIHDNHGIHVAPSMRTSQAHIYATGDVNGLVMLFHAAVRMSEVAAANILTHPEVADEFDPVEIPTTVFSTPEAHSVGLTLAQAEQRGLRAHEVRRAMGVEARAQIAEEQRGFFKMVVENDTHRVLGVHAVGVDAAVMSALSHVIVQRKLTVQDVAHMTFPHPTQFEIFDRLARNE